MKQKDEGFHIWEIQTAEEDRKWKSTLEVIALDNGLKSMHHYLPSKGKESCLRKLIEQEEIDNLL